MLSLMYENKYPDRVKRLVLLDVGLGFSQDLSFLLILLYQGIFALACMAYHIAGETVGLLVMSLFFLLPNFLKPTTGIIDILLLIRKKLRYN